MKFITENKILIAGHRGNPAHLNENTMESFKSAINLNVDMIETDVRLSKEGIPVLIHDPDVFRTSGHNGLVQDLTFEELRLLNVGSKEHPMLIPSLKEFLELCAPKKKLLIDIEIKVYRHIEGIEAVHKAIEQTVMLLEKNNMCDRILFNSFDAYVLEYIHKKYGNKFKLHGYYPYDIMSNVNTNPNTFLDYACYWENGENARKICEYLKSHGIEPCTGSNTSEADFYQAVEYGCSMFTENDPGTTMKWRDKLHKS